MKLTTKQRFLILAIIILIVIIVVLVLSRKTSTQTQTASNSAEDITQKGYSMEKTGEIDITSQTIGAQATVSSLENSFITTQNLPAKIKVPAGGYTVLIFSKGFANFNKDIKISANETVKVDAILTKIENDITEGAPI